MYTCNVIMFYWNLEFYTSTCSIKEKILTDEKKSHLLLCIKYISLTDINQTWQGCWGEGPLQLIYISLWFDEIHGRRSSILIGRFSKMFSYEITMQNNLKLCRNVLCEVFYKRSIFGSGWTNKLGRQQRYILWST